MLIDISIAWQLTMEKPEYAVTQSCFNANLIVVHNIKEKRDQDFILLY